MISLFTSTLAILLGLSLSGALSLPGPQPAPPQPTSLIQGKVFGYSAQGREILGYDIGQGQECLVLFGGIHGSERGTVALLEQLVAELEAQPGLLSHTKRVMVIPLLNPDGYFDRQDKLNTHEVNLNRNFATQDWVVQEGDDDTYAGPEPFSEVESQVLREAVNACGPNIMIAYHSQGALVSPEANPVSQALADWYAARTGYEYYDEWDYAGTATRWFVETTGGAAITVELTSHDQSDWDINKKAILELLAREQ
jgi:murein tripeptide amidase MpaA